MSRCIVSVSTGANYLRGSVRLEKSARQFSPGATLKLWRDQLPPGSPPHSVAPFAFKAHGMCDASQYHETLLWADASILPIRDMEPLWAKIEADGYYICNNGWNNGEWTADNAYPALEVSREDNWKIKHVVAGFFGVDTRHEIGREILEEYIRLAHTQAFRGPVWNSNNPEYRENFGAAPCGPPETRGHRHDQTALSVIAWRAGCQLTNPPQFFCYRGAETEETVAVADGSF